MDINLICTGNKINKFIPKNFLPNIKFVNSTRLVSVIINTYYVHDESQYCLSRFDHLFC